MKQELKFDSVKHTYKIGRQKLLSVTVWVKSFFNKFDSKAVAKKVQFFKKQKGEKVTIKQILAGWKKSADEGTLVHKELEDFIAYDELYPASLKGIKGAEWLTRFIKTIDCKKGLSLMSEVQIFDKELGLAGTCDLVIQKDDKEIIIVDWKTNSKISMENKYQKSKHPLFKNIDDCNYVHYTLQLSAYAYILERQGYKIDKLYLVHLRDDEAVTYEVTYLRDKIEEMVRYKNE